MADFAAAALTLTLSRPEGRERELKFTDGLSFVPDSASGEVSYMGMAGILDVAAAALTLTLSRPEGRERELKFTDGLSFVPDSASAEISHIGMAWNIGCCRCRPHPNPLPARGSGEGIEIHGWTVICP